MTMTIHKRKLIAALMSSALVSLLMTSNAGASLEQCGGVYIFAEAQCQFQTTEECSTNCTTVAVETSCAAQIYPSCEANCTATATAECSTDCTTVCTTDCDPTAGDAGVAADAGTAEPEQPRNCMGMCMSNCQQDCSETCADNDRQGPCRSCCAHNCSDKCEEQCKDEPEVVPVEACPETCTKVCTGSCTAQANAECQIDCQAYVYAMCETDTVETCETECETTGGAIFCDGQFLNATDVEECSAELAAEIDIHVEVELAVDVDVDVSGPRPTQTSTSSNDDDDGPSCAVARVGLPGSRQAPVGFGLFAVGAVGLLRILSNRRCAVTARKATP